MSGHTHAHTHTHTHTYTHDNYYNPRCAHAHRGLTSARVIVFLARDIPQFVMYCVNGKPRSSLFIESTDSMIRSMLLPTLA